jgi:hypothetical protein
MTTGKLTTPEERKTLVIAVLVLLGFLYLLIRCTAQQSSDGSAVPTSAPAASRCVPASTAQMAAIRAGVKGEASYNDVRSGWAVKSKEFQNVWFVASKIYGPNAENGVGPGVWAISGNPSSPGLTLSVGGFANEFSDYPDAGKTQAQMSMSSDGAQEAKQCAEAR